MREIKFRAFRKYPEPQMLYFTLEDIVNLRKPVDVIQEFPKIKDTLMQYTGLKDKNDREIYEGDIYHVGDKNIRYVVIWDDTGLIGKQLGSSSYIGLSYWQDRIEIIGNIYDNPELLKSKGEE